MKEGENVMARRMIIRQTRGKEGRGGYMKKVPIHEKRRVNRGTWTPSTRPMEERGHLG